ncbi:unnamed protein product [Vitrella brassicaformis CCMP3155]|uniref:Uncharacterized protein n=1 Tax=Vitrella brassicaformis (strain CCMP3155) TaxID=1169540 RepID=A0A0G4EQ46_VITBC|nr:unnamed protein product [Vitrella brassicaformis CCMP3155]|eukprot:CEL99723.1 unnamed protein product [Vitrella brassicaformis CCMP3155]
MPTRQQIRRQAEREREDARFTARLLQEWVYYSLIDRLSFVASFVQTAVLFGITYIPGWPDFLEPYEGLAAAVVLLRGGAFVIHCCRWIDPVSRPTNRKGREQKRIHHIHHPLQAETIDAITTETLEIDQRNNTKMIEIIDKENQKIEAVRTTQVYHCCLWTVAFAFSALFAAQSAPEEDWEDAHLENRFWALALLALSQLVVDLVLWLTVRRFMGGGRAHVESRLERMERAAASVQSARERGCPDWCAIKPSSTRCPTRSHPPHTHDVEDLLGTGGRKSKKKGKKKGVKVAEARPLLEDHYAGGSPLTFLGFSSLAATSHPPYARLHFRRTLRHQQPQPQVHSLEVTFAKENSYEGINTSPAGRNRETQ